MRKGLIGVFVLFICMVSYQPVALSGEWRIGLLLPFTGPTAIWGKYPSQGIEIAQDMINDGGGINGNKITFIKADAPNPTAAASECNRLITQENLKLIIGSGTSGNAMAATGVAEKSQVFYYEAVGVADDITGRGFKYTFRHVCKGSMIAQGLGEFIYKYLAKWLGKDPKELKVVLVHEDGPYGTSVSGSVKFGAKSQGYEIQAVETYNAKASDLSSLILKLKGMDPDVLSIVSYLQDAILFTKQMKQYNFTPKTFLGVGTGYTAIDYVKDRGKDINGFFIDWAAPYVNPDILTAEGKKIHNEFLSRYRKKYNEEPTDIAGYSFAGVWCLFSHILPKAGSLDPNKIREASLQADKPYGTYPNGFGAKFDETGQNQRAFGTCSQYQDMKPVHLYPEMVAYGKPIMIPLPPWDKRK